VNQDATHVTAGNAACSFISYVACSFISYVDDMLHSMFMSFNFKSFSTLQNCQSSVRVYNHLAHKCSSKASAMLSKRRRFLASNGIFSTASMRWSLLSRRNRFQPGVGIFSTVLSQNAAEKIPSQKQIVEKILEGCQKDTGPNKVALSKSSGKLGSKRLCCRTTTACDKN